MQIDLFLALTAVIMGGVALQIYTNFKITQIATSKVVFTLQALDQSLGEVIERIVDYVPEGEGVHPVVAIIMEAFKEAREKPIHEAKVIPARGDDGTFEKKSP